MGRVSLGRSALAALVAFHAFACEGSLVMAPRTLGEDAGPPAQDAGPADPPPAPGTDAGPASPPGTDAGPPPPPPAPGTDAGPADPPPDPSPASCYVEAMDPDADISDIVARYGGSDWKDDLIAAVRRRHPAGADLLEAQRHDSYFGTFSDPSNWGAMVGWIDTLVHEETHLFNAYHAIDVGENHAIYFREDLIYYMPAHLEGFPRREILEMVEVLRDGIYARTYLTGWQGDRGFIPLVDETTAYVNEMGTLGVLGDYYPGSGVSSRDGSVAFLYFTQLYLRRARASHPEVYETLRGSEVARELVKNNWLRTHFFLEHSDRYPGLGIHDGEYREAMYWPENLDAISEFIGHRVGDSNCLLD